MNSRPDVRCGPGEHQRSAASCWAVWRDAKVSAAELRPKICPELSGRSQSVVLFAHTRSSARKGGGERCRARAAAPGAPRLPAKAATGVRALPKGRPTASNARSGPKDLQGRANSVRAYAATSGGARSRRRTAERRVPKGFDPAQRSAVADCFRHVHRVQGICLSRCSSAARKRSA